MTFVLVRLKTVRVRDAESSLSLISSDQDPVGDTHTDSSTETSTEPSEVNATTCLGACCKIGRSKPNQPRARSILKVNGQKRSVNASWFDDIPG